MFGDVSDPRLWEPVAIHGRKISALTAPTFEVINALSPVLRQRYPDLIRYAAVADDADAERFHAIDIRAIVDRATPPGIDLAAAVLAALGIEADSIAGWIRRQENRTRGRHGQSVP
jgi:hypothetical protein